jgi:hypothetical protein
MKKWGAIALLLALLPAGRSYAQVWYSRGAYYGGGSGAVARYSTPFVPGRVSTSYAPAPSQFTWYSVGSGYSYGPQTGLPWRAQDLEYHRRPSTVQGGAGSSALAFSRAFRPSRRALYDDEPSQGAANIARRDANEPAIRAASARVNAPKPKPKQTAAPKQPAAK